MFDQNAYHQPFQSGQAGRVYKHSGAIPLIGGLMTVVVGLLAAFIGGLIYAYAFQWIPIIYINFVVTLAFGALIGGAVGWSAMTGKIRNNMLVSLLTLIFATLGVYAEWGFTPMALGIPGAGLDGLRPDVVIGLAKYLYAEGSWGMSDGAPVKGIFLAILWVVEAGTILVTAFLVCKAFGTSQPFCERCDAWTTSQEGVVFLQATGDEPAWSGIIAGDLNGLNEFVHASGRESLLVRLDVAVCGTCEDSDFLTISRVTYSTDNEGNIKEDKKPLVTNMIIDRKQLEFVYECGKPNPELDYGDAGESMEQAHGSFTAQPPESPPEQPPRPEDFNFS